MVYRYGIAQHNMKQARNTEGARCARNGARWDDQLGGAALPIETAIKEKDDQAVYRYGMCAPYSSEASTTMPAMPVRNHKPMAL
jgi:hypothetical protein